MAYVRGDVSLDFHEIGEALEKMGEIKELVPLAWNKLRKSGYKQILVVSRLGSLAVRLGIQVKDWWEVDEWILTCQTGST